ncbi:hypothetical protein EOW77_0032360 [Bradyrhizobium yuanmingense]|uniref:hypothetical protein n=1 Tax=Bradyrhizobium yuanmingense TaxID=108015 RepID=UPI000FE35DC0|nr:hypothetical protein [Bradyrhizobium yuanmingense]TGN75962.1 hypothetical protein EOW77_0032360 [Bradyrhizobium yuanmingense]
MTKHHGNVGRWGTSQDATYTTTAASPAAVVGPGVTRVRVLVTTDARIRVGKSPTATTTDTYLPANSPEYVIVSPGENVSAVQVSSGGILNVTEAD